jgi:hypothetical protein
MFSMATYHEGVHMNHLRAVQILVAILASFLLAPGVRAQRVETRVENAEVVYVGGSAVVVKLMNGELKAFEIPDSSTFIVDGKAMTVLELNPGMKLTATITTAAAPMLVDTVEVIEAGTVWKTVGSRLILKTPGGENKMYRVPARSNISVGGKEKTLDQLREGDKITATIVRMKEPQAVGGAAAVALRAPPTPARVGVLLIDEPIKPEERSGMWGTNGIVILVFALLLAAILILLAVRNRRKAKP